MLLNKKIIMKVHIITASVAVMALMAACNNTGSSKTSEQKDAAVVVTADKIDKMVTVKTVEVTPIVKTKFETKYPDATKVEWTKYEAVPPMDLDWELTGWPTLDSMDYAAKYSIDNTDYWTWYTPEGEWIATVSTINVAGVPDAVNKTLQSQFEGYTVTSVNKENDMFSYEKLHRCELAFIGQIDVSIVCNTLFSVFKIWAD